MYLNDEARRPRRGQRGCHGIAWPEIIPCSVTKCAAYSRSSLSTLLKDQGFVISRITYTNAVLFPPMALARAIQRWRGLSGEADAVQDISVPPAPVNLALTAALRLEAWWVRVLDNPFGSSLLCLARKPA